VWVGLNARQRLYLSTIFELDQAAEAEIKQAAAKRIATPPAAEWRMITYDVKLPRHLAVDSRKTLGFSGVQRRLRERGEHDDGSGSTLAALRRRSLVTVVYDHVYVPEFDIMADRLQVRLTAAGRAAARAGAGVTAPASTPAGLMSRWSLVALVRLYQSGEAGLALEAPASQADAAPSWNTLLRLRDRRDGAFMEEFRPTTIGKADVFGMRPYRVRATPAGRLHLSVHRACYAELHPDLDLPAVEPVAGAHTGLAEHRAARPRHLVRDTDLRVLLQLAELDRGERCYLREMITEEYQRWNEAPDWVATIPNGFLRWQITKLAHSEKPIDRLTAHPDGPLIEVTEVTVRRPYQADPTTMPLVVLTEHGRAHLRDHADEYRRTYPELSLP
jgi:hypothetical protein